MFAHTVCVVYPMLRIAAKGYKRMEAALHYLTFLSASRERPGTRGESAEPEPVYTVDFDQDGSFTKITKLAQSFYLRRNSRNSLGTWLQHATAMLPVMVGC